MTKPLRTVETQRANEVRNVKPPQDPNRGGDYSSIPGYISILQLDEPDMMPEGKAKGILIPSEQ